MKIKLSHVLAAILGMAGTAHAQLPCNNANDFAKKVCNLAGNYDPNPGSPNWKGDNTSPECDVGVVDKNPFIDAFNAAPDGIKTSLCQVENVFVGPFSWGRFNDPQWHGKSSNRKDKANNSYIAVTQEDIQGTFSDVQAQRLSKLNSNASSNIKFTESNTLKEFGLLYSLAHELGHIIWHRQYPSGNPQEIQCFNNNFKASWRNSSKAKKRRWTKFPDESIDDHSNQNIGMPSQATVEAEIREIYTSEFATALAATNPEEDFVDTYAVQAVFSSPKCTSANCVFSINFTAPLKSIQLNGDRGTTINGKRECANTAISTLHPRGNIRRR